MTWPPSPRLDASVVWFDVVGSTNAVAARFAGQWESGESRTRSDVLVVAGQQSEGRGRGNNRWESPTGGVYASLLTTVPPEVLGVVPMAAGVAAVAAVEAIVPSANVGLKWPNDLLAGGHKLGGLLCLSRLLGHRFVVVVGMGLNLEAPSSGGFALPAIGLRELGFTGDGESAVWSLLAEFLTSMRRCLAEPETTRSQWSARSVHVVGDRLRFRWPGGEADGRFQGFDDDGALVLEVDGQRRRFAAGELVGPLGVGGE